MELNDRAMTALEPRKMLMRLLIKLNVLLGVTSLS